MNRKANLVLHAAASVVFCLPFHGVVWAQGAPATATTGAPRQSGTVKAVTPSDMVLTTAAGQDYAVNLTPVTKVMLVDPVTRDIKTARVGSLADIAAGDKAVVSGTVGDSGQTLNAARVLLLKSGAIAAMHAEQEAAWAKSVGGIVRSKDEATHTLTVVNGARSYTVDTRPSTVVRRYSNGSVRFQDAVMSTVSAIEPGDQVQARGERSADGSTVHADEIVAGSFSNFSGLLTAVDPAASTITLKDLASKRTVTVAISPQSNLRRVPAEYAAGAAARAASARGGAAPGNRADRAESGQGETNRSAQGGAAGAARRMDLSRMVNRLPTEQLSDLKPGDAVMIVASNSGEGGHSTAVTLLSGVEQILAASPSGETTLSPWSLGSSSTEGEAGGEGGGSGR